MSGRASSAVRSAEKEKAEKKQAEQAMTSLMAQGVMGGILSAPGMLTGALFGSNRNNDNVGNAQNV